MVLLTLREWFMDAAFRVPGQGVYDFIIKHGPVTAGQVYAEHKK